MRSYSPNKGWSSTISLTLRSSLYTSCSFAGAVLMSTNPIAVPGHRAGKRLTQYNPFVAAMELREFSIFSIRTTRIFGRATALAPTSADAFGCPVPRPQNSQPTSLRCRSGGGRGLTTGRHRNPRGRRRQRRSHRRPAWEAREGFGFCRLESRWRSSRPQGRHDDRGEAQQPLRRRDPKKPFRLRDLGGVSEEVRAPLKQRAEQSGAVHVMDLLRRIKGDRSIQLGREGGDSRIVGRATCSDVDQFRCLDGVAQDRQARGFHRSLVDDRHLIAGRVREDPRGGRQGTSDGTQVGQVDALLPESVPIVRREVVSDKRRDRGLDIEARGGPGQVPCRPSERSAALHDLDGGIRLREAPQGEDVIQRNMPECAEEILQVSPLRCRCTSAKLTKAV